MNKYLQATAIAGVLSITFSCSSTKNKKDTIEQSQNGTLKSIDLSYMDKSVKPQDDFFLFANGNWVKNNPVPAQESNWGSFNELENSNMSKLTDILVHARTSSFELANENTLLGNFYQSFTDLKTRNKAGSLPVQAQVAEIMALNDKKQLAVQLAKMHQLGISSFFSFGVGQDMMDVKRNVIYLSQDGLGLPNKEYYTDKYKDIQNKYIQYIDELYRNSSQNKTAGNFGESVFSVEKQLSQSMMGPAEMRIPELSYNKMSVKEIENLLMNFDFSGYMKLVKSKEADSIIVGQPDYFKALDQFIASSSLEDLKKYLIFCTENHYASYLDSKTVALSFNFYSGTLSGKKEMKPINEVAINAITHMSVGELLGKEFVEKYYSEEAQTRVNIMVDNLLKAFEDRIHTLTWMSPETKKEALNKLHSIGRKLGFPSKWETFENLKMDPSDLKGNIDRIRLRDWEKNMKELDQPIDLAKWEMPAHMINAYYHPLLNEIAFPAGIMQAPFFDVEAEDAVNYGRIGMVIGHEFTHGFDDMGSKFGADGSFTNWWKPEDRKAFEANTVLLGKTFERFCPVDGHCVNPDLTMGENIADLGGITMAYYAYKKTAEYQSGKLIDGYTPAQRFFIAFAQLWKINYKDEELVNRISNDPHSPGMYRVNGPLMNCPEFFEAFNIPAGAKMRNSDDSISRIW